MQIISMIASTANTAFLPLMAASYCAQVERESQQLMISQFQNHCELKKVMMKLSTTWKLHLWQVHAHTVEESWWREKASMEHSGVARAIHIVDLQPQLIQIQVKSL